MKLNSPRNVGATSRIFVLLSVMLLFSPISTIMAQSSNDWTPPKLISLVSISITSSGFAAASGIVSTINDKTGVSFRIEPAPTPVDRREKIESRQVEFSVSAGGHAYSLQTGFADFDLKGWGPRTVRTVWSGGFMYAGFMARGDSGIKTVADLKGKKVADYPGYPGIRKNMEALLIYAGLTWDDVVVIPVGGFAQGMTAVNEGSVDVAFAPASSKPAIELAASPHGIQWIPMPASTKEQKEQWEELRDAWGCWLPGNANFGAGINKENPVEMMRWTNNITTDVSQDENLTYWMTKNVAENYDDYKNKHGYLRSWTLDQALFSDAWLVPYHEGSIRYFKEIGKWGAEQESMQQALLQDQIERKKAWVAKRPSWQ